MERAITATGLEQPIFIKNCLSSGAAQIMNAEVFLTRKQLRLSLPIQGHTQLYNPLLMYIL